MDSFKAALPKGECFVYNARIQVDFFYRTRFPNSNVGILSVMPLDQDVNKEQRLSLSDRSLNQTNSSGILNNILHLLHSQVNYKLNAFEFVLQGN